MSVRPLSGLTKYSCASMCKVFLIFLPLKERQGVENAAGLNPGLMKCTSWVGEESENIQPPQLLGHSSGQKVLEITKIKV